METMRNLRYFISAETWEVSVGIASNNIRPRRGNLTLDTVQFIDTGGFTRNVALTFSASPWKRL